MARKVQTKNSKKTSKVNKPNNIKKQVKPAKKPAKALKANVNAMDEKFMKIAIKEAKLGLKQNGIPIGSCLVKDGKLLGAGHNQRV